MQLSSSGGCQTESTNASEKHVPHLHAPPAAFGSPHWSRKRTRVSTSNEGVVHLFVLISSGGSGDAAAMEILIGSGRVIALGFDPGTTYLHVGNVPGKPFPGEFMTTFQIDMRSILLGFARDLGLESSRPIWANDPLVEVSRLDHTAGGQPFCSTITMSRCRTSKSVSLASTGGSSHKHSKLLYWPSLIKPIQV